MRGFSETYSEPYAAPAKLNLMLRVVGRRSDGFHLLQTVFRFIDYGDELRFRVRADGRITRANDVPHVPAEDDLCVRAAKALQQATGTPLGADIELDKRLPLGGGLGGGSSDAATTLLALNQLWKTALNRMQLIDLAVKLGADVPVFVFGENALAEGIGEQLRAIELPPAWYVVLCPPVAVSTAAVFSHPDLKRDSQKVTIQGFTDAVSAQGKTDLNDLQALVVSQYPDVARHLAWLTKFAVAPGKAMMTGSGACVFAPFGEEPAARRVFAQLPADMRGFVARGLERHPLQGLAG
jgi:4-diphosphocytidyl-2-C-methyl-D-erythritol kinase